MLAYSNCTIFSGNFYKEEITPVPIDSMSKLSKIIGQMARHHRRQVLVRNKKGQSNWIDLDKFIS